MPEATARPKWDHAAIVELVRGIAPVDWVQMRLLASLTPADRVLVAMQAQDFAMAALRGTLQRRFPELSLAELNMKVLAYLTPVRMEVRQPHREEALPTLAGNLYTDSTDFTDNNHTDQYFVTSQSTLSSVKSVYSFRSTP